MMSCFLLYFQPHQRATCNFKINFKNHFYQPPIFEIEIAVQLGTSEKNTFTGTKLFMNKSACFISPCIFLENYNDSTCSTFWCTSNMCSNCAFLFHFLIYMLLHFHKKSWPEDILMECQT